MTAQDRAALALAAQPLAVRQVLLGPPDYLPASPDGAHRLPDYLTAVLNEVTVSRVFGEAGFIGLHAA